MSQFFVQWLLFWFNNLFYYHTCQYLSQFFTITKLDWLICWIRKACGWRIFHFEFKLGLLLYKDKCWRWDCDWDEKIRWFILFSELERSRENCFFHSFFVRPRTNKCLHSALEHRKRDHVKMSLNLFDFLINLKDKVYITLYNCREEVSSDRPHNQKNSTILLFNFT